MNETLAKTTSQTTSTGPSRIPSLYFLHIPKTAGTSLRCWLQDLYRADEWLPCSVLDEVQKHSIESINAHRFYSGHFGWKIMDYLNHPLSTLTWLRDPVHRTISNYVFLIESHERLVEFGEQIGQRDEWIQYLEIVRSKSLMELVESDQYLGFNDNLQTRYLSGIFPSATSQFVDRQILERAKRNLESLFFVGICEWMPLAIDLLCYQLGMPHRPLNYELNKSSNSVRSNSLGLSDSDLQRIGEHEKYDQELYQFGQHLFQQRFEQFWREVTHESDRSSSLGAESSRFEIMEILSQYQDKDVMERVRDRINQHFQQCNRHSQMVTEGRIDFSDFVYQEGWHYRQLSPDGFHFRWAGPKNVSTIFLPLQSGCRYKVQFVVRFLANDCFVHSMSIRVGSLEIPVELQLIEAAEIEGTLAYQVSFTIPEFAVSERGLTEMIIQTEGDMEPVCSNPRLLATFATDGFDFKAA